MMQGDTAILYGRLRAERGRVSDILKVHSLRPQALSHDFDLYMGLLFGPGGAEPRAARNDRSRRVAGERLRLLRQPPSGGAVPLPARPGRARAGVLRLHESRPGAAGQGDPGLRALRARRSDNRRREDAQQLH